MNRRGSIPSPDLNNLPYFHTNFRSSEQVREFLNRHRTRPGSYILRPSFSKPNCVSVSVVLASGEVRHLNIQYVNLKYFLVPETQFNSIPALLEYHALYPVHNEEQVTDVRFLYPIVRPARLGRRATDPALLHVGYQPLIAAANAARTNGSSLSYSNSMGADEGRRRAGSDVTGAAEVNSRNVTRLSTRSEGDEKVRRSPLDRLPNVPNLEGNNLLSRRPPASLPSANGGDLVPNYSTPDQLTHDRSIQLKAALREMEISGVCDCGLPVKESQLPDGWSIHQTAEDGKSSSRRLFYQAPSGETFWDPPEELVSKFSEIHRKNIDKLKELCAIPTHSPDIPEAL